MIVPIPLGSGTRVKVAEVFSRKCSLISTSFGARGYDVANGKELLLAASPEAFARACVYVLRKPSDAAGIAERAWLRCMDTFKELQQLEDLYSRGNAPWIVWNGSGTAESTAEEAVPKVRINGRGKYLRRPLELFSSRGRSGFGSR